MAEIVASIIARSATQVVRQAARAAMSGADWVELRLDRWPLGTDLAPVLNRIALPVLVACRLPEHGGSYGGTASERRELLNHALHAGAAGLDLEDGEEWAPPVGKDRLRMLVRSHHDFTGVPPELPALRDRLFSQRATVAKIAVSADDVAAAGPVLDLLAATDQTHTPTVAFAMGRRAFPTRVLACMLGSPLVYAALDEGEETAPGQLPVAALAGLYRAGSLSGSTALYGLVGDPALHSPGPWLHNRAFRRLGVDGVYLPFETARPAALMGALPRRTLQGLSVTAPHKETMAQQCHRLDEDAAATGAVNTVTFEAHGMVVGHNTDVVGVMEALARAGLRAGDGGRGVVLGTGGAARAGAVALERLGFEVVMLGRTLEPVREFTRRRGYRLGSLRAEVLAELAPRAVVQATPVGREEGERLVPDWTVPAGIHVLDMVYAPRWTRLLQDARAAGAVPVPGMAMFLSQAARQLELFTGRTLDPATLGRFLGS